MSDMFSIAFERVVLPNFVQVMYMYYFLGYKLWAEPRLKNKRAKKRRAENTFLMALDGDVDFKPEALAILVDLLKRNKNVGAACGRIHPTGSGNVIVIVKVPCCSCIVGGVHTQFPTMQFW